MKMMMIDPSALMAPAVTEGTLNTNAISNIPRFLVSAHTCIRGGYRLHSLMVKKKINASEM